MSPGRSTSPIKRSPREHQQRTLATTQRSRMITKVFLFAALLSLAFAEESYGYDAEDSNYEPQPYHFGYHVKDHHGEQHREEASDGNGNVKGSYGFVDEKGIHREVHYVADDHGFRAEIKTNEPGTANQQPASVGFHSNSQDYLHFHEDVPEPHHAAGGYFRR